MQRGRFGRAASSVGRNFGGAAGPNTVLANRGRRLVGRWQGTPLAAAVGNGRSHIGVSLHVA